MLTRRELLSALALLPFTPSAALAAAPEPAKELLVWNRLTNNLPVLLVDGLRSRYLAGTLPDMAPLRFEDASGGLYGGLREPVTFAPKEWFWKPSWAIGPVIRHDLFKLAWCMHKLDVRRQGVLHLDAATSAVIAPRMTSHGSNDSCWLPPKEKLPRIVIELPA